MAKTYIERDLLRHAYDSVVDRCARLICFSGNSIKDLDFDDIVSRQESLAIDDLISLSINGRRLVSICGISLDGQSCRLRKWQFSISSDRVFPIPQDDYVSLQKFFGIIIHSEVLDIIDTGLEAVLAVEIHSTEYVLENYDVIALQHDHFAPKVLVKSDRSDRIVFDVGDIVRCVDRYLLPSVIEVSQEKGIYLEDYFKM